VQRLREGRCRFCSAPLDEGAKFCGECGNPVEGVARGAAQSPTAQVGGQERTAQRKEEEQAQAQQVQEPAKEIKGEVREEAVSEKRLQPWQDRLGAAGGETVGTRRTCRNSSRRHWRV
jgi:hypothetical protein